MTETLKHARGMRACNTTHAWPSETFLVNSEYSSVKVGAVSKAELELSHSNVDGAAEPDSYAAVLPTVGGDAASKVVARGGPVGTWTAPSRMVRGSWRSEQIHQLTR